MPVDRVLIEIVTAANMAGIKQAQAGFLGMNKATLGLAGALTILVAGTKSAIEIAEQHEEAEKSLAQAVRSRGESLAYAQAHVDTFIRNNSRFIKDQSEVIEGYATLTRSNLRADQVLRDLNRALDISALKHISLKEAVDLITAAEHGRLRGLIDLGISTTKYTDANGNLVKGSKDVQKAMAEIDRRTRDGRKALTDLEQSSNKLSNDWQDLANKAGPHLIEIADAVIGKIDEWYNKLIAFGKDDTAWAGIDQRLTGIAIAIHDSLLVPLQAVWAAYSGQTLPQKSPIRQAPGSPGKGQSSNPLEFKKAAGGPVSPHGVYTVGEQGPETLVMGSTGGTIIPNSGGNGTTINVTVMGHVATERQLALVIRESLRRLDREQR